MNVDTKEKNTTNSFTLGMQRLLIAVQKLSLARDMDTVVAIVRDAARELTGADGAAFVLRDGDKCYYVDENAIGPLWKGKRFPLESCISGWAMMNKQSAIIEDIYQDPRIPIDAYSPTFVKSLVMVPIRTVAPIGAIGNYWAKKYKATETEVRLLQALADSTSIAIENVQVYQELEKRVQDRTKQLEFANQELKTFSYSVAHDLRNPLQVISGFSYILSQEYAGILDDKGRHFLTDIMRQVDVMNALIHDLMQLSQVDSKELQIESVNISQLTREIVADLQKINLGRVMEFTIQDNLIVNGDIGLLKVVLTNLLTNAIKFTKFKPVARIEFGMSINRDNNQPEYFLRDNGVGFEMKDAEQLFVPFKRLSNSKEFAGTGIGLATTLRAVKRHGGAIWADSKPGLGTTFYFTLA